MEKRYILVNEIVESKNEINADNYANVIIGKGILNADTSRKLYETREEALAELKKHSCTARKVGTFSGSVYELNCWYVVEVEFDNDDEINTEDFSNIGDMDFATFEN